MGDVAVSKVSTADAAFIITMTANVASSNTAVAGIAPSNVTIAPKVNSNVLTDCPVDRPASAPGSPDGIYMLVVRWVGSNVNKHSRLTINPGPTLLNRGLAYGPYNVNQILLTSDLMPAVLLHLEKPCQLSDTT